MSQISDSGDSIDLYTTKGATFTIHIDYVDHKSLPTLFDAADKKSCVKITHRDTGYGFIEIKKAVKVTCPKKLPAIKY